MKKLYGIETSGSYTFDKTAKTITFVNLPTTITLANILLITNVTANTIIYNFADAATGVTSFTNNVLTLDYDTSSMNNSDVLQIYLDLDNSQESTDALLRRLCKILESNSVVDSSLRQRVAVEVMPSITVGTAPTTAVTNTSGFGGAFTINGIANPYSIGSVPVQYVAFGPVDQRWMLIDAAKTAYATGIRNNLIFS